jgi:DNA-binding transcriptional MerR regulator
MAIRRRTIGKLAHEAGVSVETIRFYERRGILARPKQPAEGGYRHYDDESVLLIRYIRIGQRLGFTLKDIEELKARLEDSAGFCEAVRRTVGRKLDDVRRELDKLQALETDLVKFLASCRARPADQPCPILTELHILPTEIQP